MGLAFVYGSWSSAAVGVCALFSKRREARLTKKRGPWYHMLLEMWRACVSSGTDYPSQLVSRPSGVPCWPLALSFYCC